MELDGTVPIENWTVQYDSGDVTDTPSATQGGLEDERRSARKRRAILEAGTTVFLSNGYLGTSMDEVAKLAGVSKQTVYKHFADKQRLFSEIVTAIVDEIADPNTDEVLNLKDTGNLERDLRDFARRQLRAVMQPRLLQLRRLVIGEAGRFPQLGQLFYQRGPGRTIDTLATLFERLAARGELELDDARLAAAHFNWLVMSIPLNQAMLLGQDEPATANQLRRYADTGVKAFLAAYQKH
jgi:TetR/AcrR family transcriptional regulator, mexJK operon transcriptional repressor